MPYIVTTARRSGPARCRFGRSHSWFRRPGTEIDDCSVCGAVSDDAPTRRAVATLKEARDVIYDDARPMMCDRCERPGSPWRFSDHASGSCECEGGPIDAIPAAGPDRDDYLNVRALFSLPREGGTVGPLPDPDGTVIKVEPTTGDQLGAELDHTGHRSYGWDALSDEQKCAVFNAVQEEEQPNNAEEDVKERATCSGCLARTYRGEECVCEDGGDAEDYDEAATEEPRHAYMAAIVIKADKPASEDDVEQMLSVLAHTFDHTPGFDVEWCSTPEPTTYSENDNYDVRPVAQEARR